MSGFLVWMGALAVAAMLAIGITNVGWAAVEQARAQAGADATALAGAADGLDAATEAAQRNDVLVVAITESGNIVTAVVQSGNATATAHAERRVIPVTPGPRN